MDCHPKLNRAVAIRVERAPGPISFADGALVTSLDLQPHESAELHLTVEPIFDDQRRNAPQQVFGCLPTDLIACVSSCAMKSRR